MGIENHHLANTLSNNCFKQELSIEINICGWKHDEKKDVYIISKYFPLRCWLFVKKENSNFTVGTPGTHYLTTYWLWVPPDMMRWEEHNITSVVFWSKCTVWENTNQTKIEGHSTKYKHEGVRFRNYPRPGGTKKTWQLTATSDPGLAHSPHEDISGVIYEIWMRFAANVNFRFGWLYCKFVGC